MNDLEFLEKLKAIRAAARQRAQDELDVAKAVFDEAYVAKCVAEENYYLSMQRIDAAYDAAIGIAPKDQK